MESLKINNTAQRANGDPPLGESSFNIDEFGEKQIEVDDQWKIINAYFEQNGVVNQ